jgi:hypothetical protein
VACIVPYRFINGIPEAGGLLWLKHAARRTIYSLTGTGLHGTNGLPPTTCIKLFNTYVDFCGNRSHS